MPIQNLSQVIGTLYSTNRFTSRLHSWKQESYEDCNDDNDDEQLDERETCFSITIHVRISLGRNRFFVLLCWATSYRGRLVRRGLKVLPLNPHVRLARPTRLMSATPFGYEASISFRNAMYSVIPGWSFFRRSSAKASGATPLASTRFGSKPKLISSLLSSIMLSTDDWLSPYP